MKTVPMPDPCLSASTTPSPAPAPSLPAAVRPYPNGAVVLRRERPARPDDAPPSEPVYDWPKGCPGSEIAPLPLETRMGRLTPVGLAAAGMTADVRSPVAACAARRKRGTHATPPPEEWVPRPVPAGPDIAVLFGEEGRGQVLRLVADFDPAAELARRMAAPEGGTVIEIDLCADEDDDGVVVVPMLSLRSAEVTR